MPHGYREFAPPAALRGLVECVWVRAVNGPREIRVVPDGCSDVVWQRGKGVTVVGPDTSAKLVRCAADDLMVGVRFVTGAGGGALRVPLNQLRDLRVDAADVDRSLALDPDLDPEQVAARLLDAAGGARRDPLVAEATARIEHEGLAYVARALWVSERQLRRRFDAAVGYGPGVLFRVLRFRRFVGAVDAGGRDLARLAMDAGYADQSHLSRETRRLAGLSPASFVRARGA